MVTEKDECGSTDVITLTTDGNETVAATMRAASSPDAPWGLRRWVGEAPIGPARGIVLPAAESAASRARAAVAAVCADWALCELANPSDDGLSFLDTVTLCVSELVTNAVRHPRWPRHGHRRLVLHVRESVGRLVVEVRDPDTRLPVLDLDEPVNDPENPIECHRGLRLVADLVEQWGGALWWSPLPLGGKTVAFELPTTVSCGDRSAR